MTWCTFETGYAGSCGKWVSGIKSDRCDKHKGKENKPKLEKIPKFRGDSKWQKENLLWSSK